MCLILTMIVQFYTHYMLGDNFERMAPALIFGLLLTCRLIILVQVIKKEKQDRAEMLERLIQEQNGQSEQIDDDVDEIEDNLEDKKTM